MSKKETINSNLEKIKNVQTIDNTLTIVVEELAELIQAIQKYKRLVKNDKSLRVNNLLVTSDLKEEIVDTYITVTQLAKIIEFDETDFDSRVIEKTERTLKLLGVE